MIGAADIKSALKIETAISPYMTTNLVRWALMYRGWSQYLNDDVKSMGLPQAISSEIARSITIEMKVSLSGSARAKYLQQQIDKVVPRLRQQVEYGCALGGMAFKPYVVRGQIAVDFVRADCFLPVAFDHNGNITSAVFSDTRQVGKDYLTRLEFHALEGTTYTVRNMAFKSTVRDQLGQRIPLTDVEDWAELSEETTIQNVTKPLFGYFRYPTANYIDPQSAMGVSCYARAVDLIEDADRLYSNLIWEFESGKRALYVDIAAFDRDTTGKPILPDRRLYRALNATGPVGENALFQEWSPEFRDASIKSGLDSVLKKIEFNCSLAYGTLSDPQNIERTATEMKITQQRFFALVTDAQKALHNALDALLDAMDVYITITPSLSNAVPRGAYTMVVDFDDSVIVDKESQMQQDRQAVSMGVMPKWLFLTRNYGLDEATAKQWVQEVQQTQPTEPTFGGANA